ncbi:hypothetical protein E2986_12012 [Frieseomelitta varia]|uniref:Uncharacterized protein n=1 Tax=Frieseomelitta varia TaxID=561572 RepID=A0A833RKG5_9HYME|nr:hypothetical protein E2986_12012 [Frieseomelitta varia]
MVVGNIIFKNPTFLTRTVGLALKFLQSPVSNIQLGAYHILKHVVPKLVEQDKNTIELKNLDVNALNIKNLEEVFQSTHRYHQWRLCKLPFHHKYFRCIALNINKLEEVLQSSQITE